ncbi:DUF3575 domain-containing protein [Proteiniphilum sp.]|uniref:DUF3575 domain-containing protein n=1 Tax=Proteiniphilum sp. TaxID=1926877 RepID=UPI002B206831|nr:DUF3575 domain-containing protein [Proteiniphilum sp.]MEA4916443.1 DUF3575 domain-containing protein [Proteiniphilum sp.]
MKRTVFVFAVSLMMVFSAIAQQSGYIPDGALLDGKTIVKGSITSPVFKTLDFSAERMLNRRLSLVLGTSFMPSGSFPYVHEIMDLVDMEQETEDLISAIKINTFSFSPELRIYTGKGYGRGFYVSPYYRYERFGLANMFVDFRLNQSTENIMLKGDVDTHSAGLMTGYQWLVGKNRNIVIDWTILGAHYGVNSGNFTGRYEGSIEMTEEYRDIAQKAINKAFEDLPFIEAKATVREDNSADGTISGPWAFLRGGLSIGLRF